MSGLITTRALGLELRGGHQATPSISLAERWDLLVLCVELPRAHRVAHRWPRLLSDSRSKHVPNASTPRPTPVLFGECAQWL
jgi:hypothetical protein